MIAPDGPLQSAFNKDAGAFSMKLTQVHNFASSISAEGCPIAPRSPLLPPKQAADPDE